MSDDQVETVGKLWGLALARLMRLQRKANDVTQSVLAVELDVTQGYVSGLERARAACTIALFSRWCAVLEADPVEMMARARAVVGRCMLQADAFAVSTPLEWWALSSVSPATIRTAAVYVDEAAAEVHEMNYDGGA